MKFIGTRGVIDASRWTAPFPVSGEGSGEQDRVAPGTTLPEVETTHHMKNWLECLRTRKTPNAPIDSGYAHAVATIMADESSIHGVRMVYDPAKRVIQAG